VKAAEALAGWKLGDPSWGALLVGAYLAPDEAMDRLECERDE